MNHITAPMVEAAVHKYWSSFELKASRQQQSSYAPGALIFTTSSRRVEMAQLVALHREREYLDVHTRIRTAVTNLRVLIIGSTAAVAAYSLEFHAEHLPIRGKATISHEEHVPYGRVTQIFEMVEDGGLYISHEHISAAFVGRTKA